MITFKPIVISSNKRKDGTYPVKIRVTFKGVSRRLPTSLVCKATDLTRTLKIKNQSILTIAEQTIAQMREAISNLTLFDLENKNVDWVVQYIKDHLTGSDFKLDFFAWSEEYLLKKSQPTRLAYYRALNALERYLGKRVIDINSITKTMLVDFMDYVDKEPKMFFHAKSGEFRESKVEKISKAASSQHIMKLAHLFNAAKDRYNDEDSERILIPKSPFATIKKVFPSSNGQKNLGVELMQKIISSETTDRIARVALDAFVVSFCLMGANLADLYEAKEFKGDTWVYNRRKTRTRRSDQAEMRVDLPEEIAPYLARLQEGEKAGHIWLPGLHRFGSSRNFCTERINRGLKRWCEQNEIPTFTFYAARHTWATLARKAGVEKALVDECLGHIGDYEMADIYAERSWELMTAANKKVMNMFEWVKKEES